MTLSTFLFLSTKIFQFSAKSRKAPLEGSCRHCRLRGGSLLNFNHTNRRPMVAPTPFHSNNSELQSCKRATTGRHSEILINDSKLNHTKRATNCRPYYTTIHLYESVCKSHKPKHRLTKQLCISQKQQTQYYLLLWAVYIYIYDNQSHLYSLPKLPLQKQS